MVNFCEFLKGHIPFKIVNFIFFFQNFKIYAVLCELYRRIHICKNEDIEVLVTHGETSFHVFQQKNNNRKRNYCSDVATIFLLPCLVSFPCGKLLVNQ